MTFLSILQKPIYQLLIIQALSVLAVLVYKPHGVNAAWTVIGLFYILFILVNSVFIWPATSPWQYFFISLGISILYLLISWMACSGLSRLLKLEGSGESSMLFLVIIYHPFTLIFIMLVKWVYGKLF